MNKKKLDSCLRSVALGDNKEFALLYEKTKNGIYALLYPYYRNHWDTENAMQSVYVRIRCYAHKYRSGTDARAWIFQVAKNYALNDIKKISREKCMSDDVLETVGDKTEMPTGEVFDALNNALDEREREIVVLHVLWGYKHREIAQMTDMPIGTVTSKYKTSIAKMKKYLNGENV